MPSVELRFSPLPANVRTARLLAATLGRRAGVDETLVDEVKLAVGEACARAVAVHRAADAEDDVVVTIGDEGGAFTVEVRDLGPGGAAAAPLDDPAGLVAEAAELHAEDDVATALPAGIDLAVITGLVDDVEVAEAQPGTVVRMRWPAKPADAPARGTTTDALTG